MTTLTFTIEKPCAPLNSNDRLHWKTKADRTAAWRARAHVAAIQAGRPKLDRAHVRVTVHATVKRVRDIGNYYPTVKACIDGIVGDAQVLPGDDDAHIVGPDLRPGDKAPVFTLTITLDSACVCMDCAERFQGDRP